MWVLAHGTAVRTKAAKAQSPLTRWVVVLMLAFATPAVQDVLTDLTMWVTGQACCADDCDETGAPCTQQCAHCPCGSIRIATLQSSSAEPFALSVPEPISDDGLVPPTSATLDPPFRPPVS